MDQALIHTIHSIPRSIGHGPESGCVIQALGSHSWVVVTKRIEIRNEQKGLLKARKKSKAAEKQGEK